MAPGEAHRPSSGSDRVHLRLVVESRQAPCPSPRRGDRRRRPLAWDCPSYDELSDRIDSVAQVLRAHPDPDIGEGIRKIQAWTDELNGLGIDRLVELIGEWRGEDFLRNARRDPVAGPFLARYGHSQGVTQ